MHPIGEFTGAQRFLKSVLAPSVLPKDEDDGALAAVKTRAFSTKEVKKALDEGGTRLLPGRELREIGDHVVVLKDTRTKAISTHPFDAVVLSLGVRGNHELLALYRTVRDVIQ